jgi:hypothetical protein
MAFPFSKPEVMNQSLNNLIWHAAAGLLLIAFSRSLGQLMAGVSRLSACGK